MNPKLILFAEFSALSLVTAQLTVIPVAGMLLSLVILIFAGKKFFLGFVGVLFLQQVLNFVAIVPLEFELFTLQLNSRVYGTAQGGFITHPTIAQSTHAISNFSVLFYTAAGAFSVLVFMIVVFGIVYLRLKKALVPRVRRFPS